MFRKLGWIVIIAAAAAGGCLSGSGAVRGETKAGTAAVAPSLAAAAPVAAESARR
jgi:hypothetical protein